MIGGLPSNIIHVKLQPLTITLPSGDAPVNSLGPPFVLITLLAKGGAERATGVAEAIMAEASAGLMVTVLVDATVVLVPRTSEPRVWGWVSMNAIVGPATIWDEARSRTLLTNGWPSEVMKMATGPLIPGGTTQLLNGRAVELGWPPSNIWQKRF